MSVIVHVVIRNKHAVESVLTTHLSAESPLERTEPGDTTDRRGKGCTQPRTTDGSFTKRSERARPKTKLQKRNHSSTRVAPEPSEETVSWKRFGRACAVSRCAGRDWLGSQVARAQEGKQRDCRVSFNPLSKTNPSVSGDLN